MSDQVRWVSYDSVVEAYASVAVPRFGALAHDLVRAVALGRGETVLDLGTGTGLLASHAARIVGVTACVVGVDPSMKMLAAGGSPRSWYGVVGVTPGLAIRSAAFDVVLANLVISHIPDRRRGVADVVRVLRRGGRFGCTAWAPESAGGPDNQLPDANAIAARVRAGCGLDVSVPSDAVPWEVWFQDPDHLRTALTDAGLIQAEIERRTYHSKYNVDEFLSGWGAHGRYLRAYAGETRWADFVGRAGVGLRDRFGDRIAARNDAWIASARKP